MSAARKRTTLAKPTSRESIISRWCSLAENCPGWNIVFRLKPLAFRMRTQSFVLRQTLKEQLAVVKSVSRQDDLVLRLLKQRLNHGVSVGGGNARDIRTGDNQI